MSKMPDVWVKLRVSEGNMKGTFNLDTPLIFAAYMTAMPSELEKLRAAQPEITCEDCCEVRDYDKDIAKARAEGYAQGKKEADDKYKSRLTALEKRIKELGKCVI